MIVKTPLLLGFIFSAFVVSAKEIRFTPESEMKEVLKAVKPGDSIILSNGIWKDIKLRFERVMGTEKAPIHLRAESPGKVVFTGSSQFRVSGEYVIVSGLSFRNSGGEPDVFEFRTHSERLAHHCRLTDCTFEQTESVGKKESRWVNVYGTNNRVDHCYFAGKQNKGTTLVVWVSEIEGAHRIDHNHFGPRPKLGRNGGETIRIGTSGTSELTSRTIVEKNYFEQCNGEGEIVSNKSCENIYRYNHFERCSGALTLRHGHRCVVDGNVFFGREKKDTGGVRIIGTDHQVTNNYFEGLRGDAERAAVSLMNGIPESPLNGYAPVRRALIAHNTFVDCKVSIEFGVSASKKISVAASDCQVSHNVFLPGKWELFRVHVKPRNFSWIGNKYQTGEARGADLVKIERVNISLERSADGLLRPSGLAMLQTKATSSVKTDIDGLARDSKLAGCDDPQTEMVNRMIGSNAGPSWREK